MQNLKNFSILFASLFVSLVVLEIALRIMPCREIQVNNPYQYTLLVGKMNFATPFNCYREIYPIQFDRRNYYRKTNGAIDYCTNQLGARWIRPETQNPQDKPIIVVGDSLTYGFGIRYEDTFIYKLQNLLQRNGIHYYFLNFSEPATDSRKCLTIYRKNQDKIPSDMLIYGLHINDLIQFPTSFVICNITRKDFWLRKKSKLADFIFTKLENEIGRKRNIGTLLHPSRFQEKYWNENMDAIKQMNVEATQRKVKFVVVILPILIDIQKNTFEPVYDKIKATFNENGIRYFGLTSSVSGFKDAQLWILPFDQHPNEIANAIFAQVLYKLFKNELHY